ncbi:MAG: hypothetical protein EOO13_06125 [Chitinophagaceae bacterium]|nr:MAG: hypothetical protein EOO13_06125 [Chitinophagaceae bacterium]
MKLLPLLALSLFLHFSAAAQRISRQDLVVLKKQEDSLKNLSLKIIQGINSSDRFLADSIFTKVFVRALKTPNSIYFPFDSVYTVSKLYAPDSSFRIYTWQMVINDNIIRQHGAIQMRTADGSLKLFPLIDKSDITTNIADTIASNLGWMGAVYYRIIETKAQGKSFYTLLGYDENNIRSNKKVIEVLTFNNGQPQFGAKQFSIPSGFGYKNTMARFILEFKKDASPRLTYDTDLNMIVFEHLISESNQPNKKWTLVGDGDYEGFKWMDGRWVYVNKIFNEVTPEGKAPAPVPLNDSKLNTTPPPGNY